MKSIIRITEDMKREMFMSCKEDVAQQIIAAVLYGKHLQGYRKKRIQREFNSIMAILEMPDVIGKSLEGIKVMELLSEKYGINFSRVKVRTETETEERKRK